MKKATKKVKAKKRVYNTGKKYDPFKVLRPKKKKRVVPKALRAYEDKINKGGSTWGTNWGQ